MLLHYAAGVENFSELTLGRNEDETKRIRNPSIIMFINITKYHIAANCKENMYVFDKY